MGLGRPLVFQVRAVLALHVHSPARIPPSLLRRVHLLGRCPRSPPSFLNQTPSCIFRTPRLYLMPPAFGVLSLGVVTNTLMPLPRLPQQVRITQFHSKHLNRGLTIFVALVRNWWRSPFSASRCFPYYSAHYIHPSKSFFSYSLPPPNHQHLHI